MFPFGSGMRPSQNPPPSAPPSVQSNPHYSGPAPAQMPQPFGSGIGFRPQVINAPFGQGPPMRPQNSVQVAPYPTHNHTPPQVAPYPNYPTQNPSYPPNNSIPSHSNFAQANQTPPNAYPPQTHYPAAQNTPQASYPSYNYTQTPPNVYPNLQHVAPFSYLQPNPIPMQRSTSGYMRKGTPTVLPHENFDAQVDAATLRKAMKGFGCDEKALIDVICRRSNPQRQEIQKVFKTNFGKDLIENIESETRGNFETLLVALLTPTLDFYCKEIKEGMSGIGTDEAVLIETLSTLSNYEINMIKAHYQQKYKQDLESAIIGETSGNFKRLLVSLCTANRDESGATDPEQAKADATALLRAGELMFGTDESVFNNILCQRNYEQLKLIFKEYQEMTGHSFEKAIKNEFSGDVKDGFVAIFRCVNDKAEFFAHQLMKSMKGIGTNDRQLIRLVVTRCEIDMTEIKAAFERLFNETLKDCIKGDTSGDYKHALYALIGEQRSS